MTQPPLDAATLALIDLAVREDLGEPPADLTVNLSIPADHRSTATIVARKTGTLAGGYFLPHILGRYSPDATCELLLPDASRLSPHQPIARLAGPTRALLSAERVLLNFLGHLSGIATVTRRYVDAVTHLPHPPAICDTRKTTPGFRRLDKYAVTCGGGVNHRLSLYDGVMLKDNHLAALRDKLGQGQTLAQLTAHIRQQLPAHIPLWLEVDTLAQLQEALPGGGADIILLDNFTPDQTAQAVQLRDQLKTQGPRPRTPLLESSGGITLDNIAAFAAAGVDRISIGALTHSAPVLDVSMELA